MTTVENEGSTDHPIVTVKPSGTVKISGDANETTEAFWVDIEDHLAGRAVCEHCKGTGIAQ